MRKNDKFLVFKLLTFFFVLNSYSQQMTPNKVDPLIVESIKETIWIPFMESYRELDVTKLVSLYANELTRVSLDLNKIENKSEFSESMRSFFERMRTMNLQMDIRFSIVSTATSNDKVYQTGYYSFGLRKNKDEPYRISGYSRFDVLLVKDKSNGSWSIVLDSDKRENLTEEEFLDSGMLYKLEQ